ncbi:hypothetical protein [Paenibacillus piri]|uniref:Lipoprotein n=1 Tax=Paenibacillus piri TaxID=2547395 RepID=A0A4R5KIY8_9BACL|nr:hypothetical protein [Paenibacillus piri]TDF95082.1 hypothetical protein E1757_21340 [Paenibacillus piri]
MRSLLVVALLSLLLFNACSSKQKYTSVIEAIKSEGIQVTSVESPKEAELQNVSPLSYKIDNDEIIRVYDFGSKEKRELGMKQFQERQQVLSSHAPIAYEVRDYFILYYSASPSKTQTPKLAETKYGTQIQKAMDLIR